jgi:SAM-dependent methyltransferase
LAVYRRPDTAAIDSGTPDRYLRTVPPSEPEPIDPDSLSSLYRERFSESDIAFKEEMWTVLCERVFQPYVRLSDTVLDLGAGRCEFINAIEASEKIAVDLNPDLATYARGARVVRTPSTDLSPVDSDSVDVVFSSNFLEHLPDKASVLRTLAECRRVLRPGGAAIVLMPNIRYLAGKYWDYFDHHTPLTHLSLIEALALTGFRIERVVPRFLPYTVKQRGLPKSTALLRLYLSLRIVWPIFGRQMLIVARASDG